MGLFDWFVAELTCRKCGRRSAADNTTSVQTKLREDARQNCLGVGAALTVTPESAEDARYTLLSLPSGPEIRILQHWECPACGDLGQWLEVVVHDGQIASIESIRFDAAVLAAAHYIEDETLLFAATAHPDAPPMLVDRALALDLLRRHVGLSPGPQRRAP